MNNPGDRFSARNAPAFDVDVVIIGAGPAGVSSALHLHRQGLRVLIVDKASFPRDKTCGDGLTTLALRELERLGLDPSLIPSWTKVNRTFLHAPSGRIVTLPLPEGPGTFAAVARRSELDYELVQLALRAGIRIEENTKLEDARSEGDGITVRLDRLGEVRARWAIGADGMWSPLRRLVGAAEPGYRGEWHAFRQYFENTAPGAQNLHVWFEPDLLPGYMWSFPVGASGANVGFGVTRGAHLNGGELARLWPELLKRPGIRRVLGVDAQPVGTHRAWPIPAGIKAATLTHGRCLFVGDAVRAGDVLTGEGIGQALLTGRLAAEAIAGTAASSGRSAGPKAQSPDPDDETQVVTARYEAAVRHELTSDHQMALILNRLLAHRVRAEAAIGIIGLSEWNRRNFARWLFEDSPRGIALTPRRWRRGALTGPAAFLDSPVTEQSRR